MAIQLTSDVWNVDRLDEYDRMESKNYDADGNFVDPGYSRTILHKEYEKFLDYPEIVGLVYNTDPADVWQLPKGLYDFIRKAVDDADKAGEPLEFDRDAKGVGDYKLGTLEKLDPPEMKRESLAELGY